MSGYVIVVSGNPPTAETFSVDDDGLLAVIAMLENPNPAPAPGEGDFQLAILGNGVNVRTEPAGAKIGSLAANSMVWAFEPAQSVLFYGVVYDWVRIEQPMAGWIVDGAGITLRI